MEMLILAVGSGMELLILAALVVGAAHLWSRFTQALERIEQLEDRVFDLTHRLEALGGVNETSHAPTNYGSEDVGEAAFADFEDEDLDDFVGEPEPELPEQKQSDERVSVPTVSLIRRSEQTEVSVSVAEAEADTWPDDAAAETYASEEANAPAAPRFQFDLEDIFGRRLPIWAGGLTLAIAGVFLVRYSIEAGLLTQSVRVLLAFIFGLGLLGLAEFAYRKEDFLVDPRVRQALAGAGLATLYAGFYLAGSQYQLVGQAVAFLGLAGVTAAAIALSFRFGLPCAVLGLVGGFAAPALVGGDEANLPVLALYLALVTGGLAFTSKRQSQPWLGIAALVAGLGWGVLMLMAGDFGMGAVLSMGLYMVVIGVVLPGLVGVPGYQRQVRLAAAFVASVQLALLVAQGGFSPLTWGLYLLLGATYAGFAWGKPELREGNAAAAVIAMLLLAIWPYPDPATFAVVSAAAAALFAALPLASIWLGKDTLIDRLMLAIVPPVIAAIAYATFGTFEFDTLEGSLAAASFALSLLPIAGAWRMSRDFSSVMSVGLLASGAALIFAGLLMLTPGWSAPVVALAVLSALIGLSRRSEDNAGLLNLCWIAAGVTMLSLLVTPGFLGEVEHLFGPATAEQPFQSIARWASIAAAFAALVWFDHRDAPSHGGEIGAAIFLYGTLAQIVPAQALAWMAALLGIAAFIVLSKRAAAFLTLLAIAALWAIVPVGTWLEATIGSLAGWPAFVDDLPSIKEVLLRIAPVLACLLAIQVRRTDSLDLPKQASWLAAPLALIAAHIAFKQIFAIETVSGFVDYGLAERTLWQALLLAAGWLAWRGVPRLGSSQRLAFAFGAASLAHFVGYTGLLHNPLWDAQAVGATPIANLGLAAYALAIATALSLRHWSPPQVRVAFDGLVMVFASLGALTLLRQIFAGSVLVEVPMTQTEDLLRSLLGIILAVAFLLIGSRLGERSWRIGSLVIMLIAVAKVFIVDAAGLEGLLRIASFMALGFSLIGIGWFYARQLKAAPQEQSTQQ